MLIFNCISPLSFFRQLSLLWSGTDTRLPKFSTYTYVNYIRATQLRACFLTILYLMSSTEAIAVNAAEEASASSSTSAAVQTSPTHLERPRGQPPNCPTSIEVITRPHQRTVSKGSSTSSNSTKPSVSSAPPLSSSSVEFSSVTSAEAGAAGSSNSSRMSTSSSLGLSAQGEAAPPLGAKTEEVVRGIAFKVSIVLMLHSSEIRGLCLMK